ncbi:MAG TPA: S8 family serine peptidase [Isosphaeraceae bacterium]|jgi:subtilisin family serine protease|nr:S8 family serine peptidase [Isosphaeraceae bacterium]
MARTPKRRAPRLRPDIPERLEARSLLSTTAGGMWPLNNPSPADSLLVGFAPTATASRQQALLNEFGAYVAQRFESGPVLITLGRGVTPAAAAAAFRATPGVLFAEPDRAIQAQTVPNDPSFPQQYALSNPNGPDMQATQAWSITTGNPAITVADIDTGIDYTNKDLYLNIWINQAAIPSTLKSEIVHTDGGANIDFADLNSLNAQGQVVLNGQGKPVNSPYVSDRNGNGYIDAADLVGDPTTGLAADPNWVPSGSSGDLIGQSFLGNGATVNDTPRDDNGHGTMTGGIIGAMTNDGLGVAGIDWNARIMPLKFLDSSGSGYDTDAISAIQYAADHGAKVINASWGDTQDDPALDQAIAYADGKGVLFVAAAGNNGQSNDNASTAFYPASANVPNVISVAAVGSTGALASFSNYGANSVALGAPGVGIYSVKNGGGVTSGSGTSFAAPQVSGVAALVAGLNPSLSPEQIIQVLKSTVQPLASLAGKTETGGMVDAYKAVQAAAPATTATPTIVDNGTAGYSETGTWNNWSTGYGGTLRYAGFGNGADTATWQVNNLAAGTYVVQTTWNGSRNHATNAPYRIYDGTNLLQTVAVDQSQNPVGTSYGGVAFEGLTTVHVTSGTLKVVLSDAANNYVVADAVRVAPASSSAVDWNGGGVTGPSSVAAGSTFTVNRTYDIPAGLAPGPFTIRYYASTHASPGNPGDILLATEAVTSSSALTTGLHAGTSPSLSVPSGGSYNIFAVLDDGNSAAALPLTVTGGSSLIVDNGTAGYSETGTWYNWSTGYGGTLRYAGFGNGADTATWQATGLAPGSYVVQATWNGSRNHATNAPYRIYDGTNLLQTVAVDQSQNPVGTSYGGVAFQTLATVTVSSGTLKVVLSDAANNYVVADAVRIAQA